MWEKVALAVVVLGLAVWVSRLRGWIVAAIFFLALTISYLIDNGYAHHHLPRLYTPLYTFRGKEIRGHELLFGIFDYLVIFLICLVISRIIFVWARWFNRRSEDASVRAKRAFAEGYVKGKQSAEQAYASSAPPQSASSEPQRPVNLNEPPPVQAKYRTERVRVAATAEQPAQQPKPTAPRPEAEKAAPKPPKKTGTGLPSDRW